MQARAPVGAPHSTPGEAAAGKLMDLLEDYDGIVSAGADSWDATISIQSHASAAAAGDGAVLIQEMASKAGMPDWPAVRIEAIRQDVLDEQLAQPDRPDLVSAPEAAQILGVSSQRLHELVATRKDFPAPVYELRAGKLWLRAAIEAFARRWERKAGRPRKAAAAAG